MNRPAHVSHRLSPANEYFHFNDERVTRIGKETIYADTHSNANPYLLVYAKKGAGVVDTIKRRAVQAKAAVSAYWQEMEEERAMAEALVMLDPERESAAPGATQKPQLTLA